MSLINIGSKEKNKLEEHIRVLQEMCNNDVYSCNGELIRIFKSFYIKPLVKELKEGQIKLSSDLVFNKLVVSLDELFLYNLDRYICYVRDTYFINHAELQAILPLTLNNKYSKILLSKDDFHKDFNYLNYYNEFRRMFLFNIYENVFFYNEHTSGFLSLKRFATQIENYNFDDNKDILKLENIFIQIINNRNNNLYNSFVSYREIDKEHYHFERRQLETILDEYYDNNKLKQFDIVDKDNYIEVQNGSTILFNLKSNTKGQKSRKSLFIEFGIKNDNFNAKVGDILLEKNELLNLVTKLKNNNEKEKYDEVTYINPTLRFNFWCDNGNRFLDIIFEYGNGCDYYSLSLNKKDIKKLCDLIVKQIH